MKTITSDFEQALAELQRVASPLGLAIIPLEARELDELHDFWNERISSSSPDGTDMQKVSKRVRQMVFTALREHYFINAELLKTTQRLEKEKGA